MSLSELELKQFIEEYTINNTKLAVQNLIDVYRDNWQSIIRDELRRQFQPSTLQKLKHLITREMNIVKKVTDETSLVYKNGATRHALVETRTNDGEIEFSIDDNYASIMEDSPLNGIMKQVNSFTKLTNQTMLKIVWRNKKLDYDLLTFDNVEIFTDPEDWKKIIAVKYYIDLELPNTYDEAYTDAPIAGGDFYDNDSFGVNIEDADDVEFNTMFLWTLEDKNSNGDYTKSFVRTYKNVDGKRQEIEKEDNPYIDEDGLPVLPFVFIPNKAPHQSLLDFTTGNDIFDGNLNIALNYIHLNELIKFQAYKQIWIKAENLKEFPDTWNLDASSIITLTDKNNTTQIGTLDLESNITDLWQVIKERIILILSARGIPPSAVRVDSAAPASGIAIRLDKQTLMEMREDDVEIYREAEKEIFHISRIVNNHHNPNMQISNAAKLKVDFGEITFPMSRLDMVSADSVELTNNTITGAEILQRKNPDLTDDEAKEKFELNKQANKSSFGLSGVQQPETDAG